METDSFYQTTTLANGLRVIHLPVSSPVSYCGFAVDIGSRDELSQEYGMAHFVEHMLFKGTARRRAWHILNRMEAVGGELNAYTAKEETFLYASFLEQDFGRAAELLCDIVRGSNFPTQEVEKELEVIADEINSYRDNPSELIYDDFENALFAGHAFGHYILGTEASLKNLNGLRGRTFMDAFYTPDRMLFFSMGSTPFSRIIRVLEREMGDFKSEGSPLLREAPPVSGVVRASEAMETYQSHVVIGNRTFSMYDDRRGTISLLNNILGGPGMNSRLNLSLRERSGYVYTVESNVTLFTDTGLFTVYFGTDPKNCEKAIRLVYKEMKGLCQRELSGSQLHAAKRQLIGQMGVGSDNRENRILGIAKTFLRFNECDSMAEIAKRIEAITASQVCALANELFDESSLSELVFRGDEEK